MIGLSAVGRLGLPPAGPVGNLYAALLRAGLIAARSTDTALWMVADDLSNVWQDAAGTIPCTAEGQPVGFLADQQYRASGPELVVNGTFDANLNGWSVGVAWTWLNGTAKCNGANSNLSQAAVPSTAGATLTIEVTVTTASAVAGSLFRIRYNGAAVFVSPTVPPVGTYRTTVTAVASAAVEVQPVNGWDGAVDNISVREVLSEPNATAFGPELITDEGSNPAKWVSTAGATVTSPQPGTIRLTAGATGLRLCSFQIPGSYGAGRTFRLTAEIRSDGGDAVLAHSILTALSGTVASTPGAGYNSAAWLPVQIIMQTTDSAEFFGMRLTSASNAANACEMRNISVRELPGYHATQPTAGNRPTLVRLANGRWGLNFNGTNNFLQTPVFLQSASATIISASEMPAGVSNRTMFASGTYFPAGTPAFALQTSSGQIRARVANTADSASLTSAIPSYLQGQQRVLTSAVSGANGQNFVDGVLVGGLSNLPTSIASAVAHRIGSSVSGNDWLLGTLPLVAAGAQSLPDPTRIAIERLAAAHSGAPYLA